MCDISCNRQLCIYGRRSFMFSRSFVHAHRPAGYYLFILYNTRHPPPQTHSNQVEERSVRELRTSGKYRFLRNEIRVAKNKLDSS
jgi:hypothetical protein